jgi:hypothetical protein
VVDTHGVAPVVRIIRVGVLVVQAHHHVIHKGAPHTLDALLQRVVAQHLGVPLVGEEEALKHGQSNAVQDLLGQTQEVCQPVDAEQVQLVLAEGVEAPCLHGTCSAGGVLHEVLELLQQPGHVLGRDGDPRDAQELRGHLRRVREGGDQGTNRKEGVHCWKGQGRKERAGKLCQPTVSLRTLWRHQGNYSSPRVSIFSHTRQILQSVCREFMIQLQYQ